jgi:hypothetical protein
MTFDEKWGGVKRERERERERKKKKYKERVKGNKMRRNMWEISARVFFGK